ncbi:MAG: hypothetical protein ACFE0Q_18560 [Anaerolineae bacterium]
MTISKWISGFIIVLIVVSIGLVTYRTQSFMTIDQHLLITGIDVYRSNYCGSCHTLTIANTRGIFGPNHDNIREDADAIINSETYVGRASTIEAYIYESIIEPDAFYTPGYESSNHHMPAFDHLSEEDLNAMVYMLSNQDAFEVSE